MIDIVALRLQAERTTRAVEDPTVKTLNNHTKKAVARDKVIPNIAVKAGRIDVNIEELVEGEAGKQTTLTTRASITADNTPESVFEGNIVLGDLLLEKTDNGGNK